MIESPIRRTVFQKPLRCDARQAIEENAIMRLYSRKARLHCQRCLNIYFNVIPSAAPTKNGPPPESRLISAPCLI